LIGSANATCSSAQNTALTSLVVHHYRHRPIVEGSTPSASCWQITATMTPPARLPLTRIMIAATWTRRPRMRTENGVA